MSDSKNSCFKFATMTIHNRQGKISLGKIGIIFGILASCATIVLALPTAMDYLHAAVAPWTSLPVKLDEIQKDVADIKRILDKDNHVYIPPPETPASLAYKHEKELNK